MFRTFSLSVLLCLSVLVAAAATPTADSVTPNSGTGTTQSFTFNYTDTSGATDINIAEALFNTSVVGANGCFVILFRQPNLFYLANDQGSGTAGSITPGSGSVSNSYCTLNGAGSSFSVSGNSLTMILSLTFSPAFPGTKNIYMLAGSVGGQDSGFQPRGTWNTGVPEILPTADISPKNSSGATQTFNVTLSDTGGAATINSAFILFNSNLNGAGACYAFYSVSSNSLYLVNDAGTGFLSPVVPGGGGSAVSNSQCTLSPGPAITTTPTSITVPVNLTFLPTFTGVKSIYGFVYDNSFGSTGWQQLGTWSRSPHSPPTVVGVNPQSGNGTSSTFQFTFASADGYADILQTYMLFNSTLNGTGACYVIYSRQANALYLVNDAGTGFQAGTVTPGSAATLSNSQCTLASGGAVTTTATTLTVPVMLTFTSAFSGQKNIYALAIDSAGGSGWQQAGAFSVGSIGVSNVSVGQNLQTAVTVSLAQPAPPGGIQVTVSSGDPSKVLVAARPSDAGSNSTLVTIGGNLSSVTVYVQGIASSGTVTLTAAANGLGSGTGTITLTPSGFVLSGPGGLGVSSLSTGVGLSTNLTVTAARLDAALNFVEAQPLRVGATASVPVTSSDTTVGTIGTTPVNFTGGQGTATAIFTAVGTGSTTVTAGVPSGFSTPAANANALNVTSATGLIPGSVTVGNNLQVTTNVSLIGAAPPSGLTITITSNDSSKVLLSTDAGTLGTGSIMLTIPAGFTHTSDFYIQGLASSGTVLYTATAGSATATGTVTLTPAGIIIYGPYGAGVDFPTSTAAGSSVIAAYTAQLIPGSASVASIQQLRGGFSTSVNVTSSNTSVGTVAPSPITIAGGTFTATTAFQPLAVGSTLLSVSVPAGFTAPAQDQTLTAIVKNGIGIPPPSTVGMNLEIAGTLSLGQAAPSGGLPVTLTSNDPHLLLSASATTAGMTSLMVTIPQGSTTATFYMQGFASSGSATYTAAANGYSTSTGTVNFATSGVVLSGPVGIGFPFPYPTTIAKGPITTTVQTAMFDGLGNYAIQSLAGGLTLTANLSTNPATVGTVTPQVTINGGTDNASGSFTPLAVGTTTVSVATPAGFVPAPSADTMFQIQITQ